MHYRDLNNNCSLALGTMMDFIVDVESLGKQILITFLERSKDEFTNKYRGGKAATAVSSSLKREFG